MAEYVETEDYERNAAARLVEKRRHIPLPRFFTMRSLYAMDPAAQRVIAAMRAVGGQHEAGQMDDFRSGGHRSFGAAAMAWPL